MCYFQTMAQSSSVVPPESGASNTLELSREDIKRLLRRLDAVLVDRGQKITIYVIGGANIAIALDARRVTTDIDVVVKQGFEFLSDAAKKVAETEPNLGEDWINSQFTSHTRAAGMTWQWFDNKDDDRPSTFLKGDGLTVELASPEMILALKTLAQRPQDMSDIYELMRATGIRDAQGIGRNLARFTGRRIFEAQGKPGMFLHIDPTFSNIMDNAPADLRTHVTEPQRCPAMLSAAGDSVQCQKTSGHRFRHRFPNRRRTP